MSNLVLEPKWNAVTQLERATKVDAGVGGNGPANLQPKELGNRDEWLKEQLVARPHWQAGGLVWRQLATIPEADLVDGMIRLVQGHGLYRWIEGSSLTEQWPYVIEHDTADGRWVHYLVPLNGAALGFTTGTMLGAQRLVMIPPAPQVLTAGWTANAGKPLLTLPADGTMIVVPIPTIHLPRGSRLELIRVQFDAASGHADLPASQAAVAVRRRKMTTDLNAEDELNGTLAWQNRPGVEIHTDIGDYESAGQLFYFCGQNNIIEPYPYDADDARAFYYIVIRSESGANAVAGAKVGLIELTYYTPVQFPYQGDTGSTSE